MARTKDIITSHNGHPLTIKEDIFISKYIELGNASKAVIEAGYNVKNPAQHSQTLLNKDYVADEIRYRQSLVQKESIANATEIMEYFTAVMRGEITDQFGLEAPLGERTKCAQELAKRQIDIPNRVAGEQVDSAVKIILDWGQTAETPKTDTAPLSSVNGIMPSDVVALVHNLAVSDKDGNRTTSVEE